MSGFTLTSILVETIFMLVFYRVVVFLLLGPVLEQIYSSRPWWDYLKSYRGNLHDDVQVEIVYVSLLGIHHIIGGFVMLYAFVYGHPNLFAHGMLWELTDDIHDLLCMAFLFWPVDEVNMNMFVKMGIHHISGAIIIVPGLIRGIHLNRHLQLIGVALLLAGGFTCTQLAVSRTMNRRVALEAWMDFILWTFGSLFFSVCRFYIFPYQLYLYILETEWDSLLLKYFLYVSSCTMMVFNLLIFKDGFVGTVSRFFIALNNGEKHAFDITCGCGRCLRRRGREHDE